VCGEDGTEDRPLAVHAALRLLLLLKGTSRTDAKVAGWAQESQSLRPLHRVPEAIRQIARFALQHCAGRSTGLCTECTGGGTHAQAKNHEAQGCAIGGSSSRQLQCAHVCANRCAVAVCSSR
jgi:hypothetical protein